MPETSGDDDPAVRNMPLWRMVQIEVRCERWVNALSHVASRAPGASNTYFTSMNLARPEAREILGHGAADEVEQARDLVGGPFQQSVHMLRAVMAWPLPPVGRVLENGDRSERALNALSLPVSVPASPDVGPDLRAKDIVVICFGVARQRVKVDGQEDVEITLERGSEALRMQHGPRALGPQTRALRKSLLESFVSPGTHVAMMMTIA